MNLFVEKAPLIWLAGLFIFLLLCAVLTVWVVNKKKRTVSAGRLAAIYMALKGFRFLVFTGAVLLYLLTVKVEARSFVLAAVAIYVVYLLWDTVFLTVTERRLRKK
jgi:hypothetical protein